MGLHLLVILAGQRHVEEVLVLAQLAKGHTAAAIMKGGDAWVKSDDSQIRKKL